MDMDFFQPDLQQGGAQGPTLCPRSWQSPATHLKFLGVVALLSAGLQLAAVWPDEHHWAKLSPSFAELTDAFLDADV